MSATGERLAAEFIAAVDSDLGITKGAAASPEIRYMRDTVRDLCKALGRLQDMVSEHLEHTRPVLDAIAQPLPEQQYLGPLRPDQWRVGLVPTLPGQEHPVRGNNDEFS